MKFYSGSMPAAHDFETISRAVRRCESRCRHWEGTIYRAVSPRYFTQKSIVSGEGSEEHGGRWSPRGIKAVHGSLTPETAMAETLQRYRYAGVPIAKAMPKVFGAIQVTVSKCLDLTDSDLCRALGVVLDEALDADWRARQEEYGESSTQAIGRAVYSAGIEAVIDPSAAEDGGRNVIVFPDVLQPGSTLRPEGV
jgi:RES domain-containing protein